MGVRAQEEEQQSSTGSRRKGYSVAAILPTMKRLRWLLNLLPNLVALLASAVFRLRTALAWPGRKVRRWMMMRRRRRVRLEEQTQALEQVKLEEERKEGEEEGEKAGQGVEDVPLVAPQAPGGWLALSGRCQTPGEHFEISFNFVRHLFDTLVVGFLCLASPVFRVVLDVLGPRGLLKLWLHGMALFLVVSYGMALVLWLMQTYIVQLALLFGAVQLMVLGVSIQQQERAELERKTQDLEDPIAPSDL
ncbi:hypothetical protein scyTo_0001116 [Scyliorhinus torazame]|uniref:Uncharacterized protein n=1 Tax=Scyliorhinus torazame TaxID=75743 RepID=A0A401P9A1_SCYTO|nr:hypothetical protein [Scyliorhinus torazame]